MPEHVARIVSRAEFAKMCGVSGAAITRACSRALAPAAVGKRIDAGHPAAVKYREDKVNAPTAPAPGVDPLYPAALELCQSVGRVSAKMLIEELHVSHGRAASMRDMINASGLVEAPPPAAPREPKPKPEPPRKRRVPTGKPKADPPPPTPPVGDESPPIPDDIARYIDRTLGEIVTEFGTSTRFLDWLKSIQIIEGIEEKRIKNAKTVSELIHRDLVKLGIVDPLDTALKKLLTDGVRTISRRAVTLCDAGEGVEEVQAMVADQIESFIKPMKKRMRRALESAGA